MSWKLQAKMYVMEWLDQCTKYARSIQSNIAHVIPVKVAVDI